MKINPKSNPIEIKCKGSKMMELKKLVKFQGGLKVLKPKNRDRLALSICEKGFIAPIFVWETPEKRSMILDGHQRVSTLQWMSEKGWEIPKLPVVVVEAENEQDAREKILAISSQYGEFDPRETEKWIAEASEGFDDIIRLMGSELKLKGPEGQEQAPEVEFAEELLESHNFVVLYFDNDVDWLQAETLLGLKTEKAHHSKKGFVSKGVGRVVRGPEAIEKIRGDLQ